MRRYAETMTPGFVMLVAAGLILLIIASVILIVMYSGTISRNGRLTADVPSLSRTNGMPRYDLTGEQDAVIGGHSRPLPDFRGIKSIKQRKQSFFAYMAPLVVKENARLLEIRNRLTYIHDHVRFGRTPDSKDLSWISELAREFKLPEDDPLEIEFWQAALLRIDRIPFEIVLAQAANESAWGTSRFARLGNNLFGQWCFTANCGIIPVGRPQGETYEVARYGSVSESISSYMRNLNTGRSYRSFRQLRASMNEQGQQPDPMVLASGLEHYSQRGLEYVKEIKAMIRQNSALMTDALTQTLIE